MRVQKKKRLTLIKQIKKWLLNEEGTEPYLRKLLSIKLKRNELYISEMASEQFSFVKGAEDQLFLGSLRNLFDKSYTNKTFIDTYWARESPREAEISNLQMFNVEFEKGKIHFHMLFSY